MGKNLKYLQLIAISFGFLFFVIPALFSPQQTPITLSNTTQKLMEAPNSHVNGLSSYITHDSIYITSNEDFEEQGFLGSGIAGDPYVIEGYSITTAGNCITVEDTDAYFIIRDCLLIGTASATGIRFARIDHGEIRNNTISGQMFGVAIFVSSNIRVVNNIISGNEYGVHLCSSSDNVIENNSIFGNYRGVNSLSASNNTIVDNIISGNDVGVNFYLSANYTLSSNIFLNNGIRIYGNDLEYWHHTIDIDNLVNGKPLGYFRDLIYETIDGSQYGQVILANCTSVTVDGGVYNNATVGIITGYSSYSYLTNNIVSSNHFGIELYNSSDSTVENNTIFENSYFGVQLIGSSEIKIENNTVFDNREGIGIYYSSNCSIVDNNVFGNLFGVDIVGSINNTLSSNAFVNNGIRIRVEANFENEENEKYWHHTITIDNLVNGKPLGYFWNWNGGTIDGSHYGQVILANCTGVTVKNGEFNNASVGIELGYSSYCSLTNNTISRNVFGVEFYSSSYSTVENNTISENSYSGLELSHSTNNTVEGNTVSANGVGVYMSHSTNSTVEDNVIFENTYSGVFLRFSINNKIQNNTISGNSDIGVHLSCGANSNLIYLNIIANNDNGNAYDHGIDNQWNTTGMGNFWSDYVGFGVYNISGGAAIDYYPFIYPSDATNESTNEPTNEDAIISGINLLFVVGIGLVVAVLIILRYPKGSMIE